MDSLNTRILINVDAIVEQLVPNCILEKPSIHELVDKTYLNFADSYSSDDVNKFILCLRDFRSFVFALYLSLNAFVCLSVGAMYDLISDVSEEVTE